MRVLIVEDNTSLKETLIEALSEEGYAVDATEDGEEGLFMATSVPYDLILLDIMLPKKDGWQVLAGIRESDEFGNAAVIMLTARDTTDDRVRGLDQGADDYIAKPFQLAELFARVRSVTRRSRGNERSPIRRVAGLEIDTSKKEIHVNGELIETTAMEYALVDVLTVEPGRVLSRSELYEKLFPDEKENFSNILDVYVYNLRKKFGKDFIHTKRGQGYCVKDSL